MSGFGSGGFGSVPWGSGSGPDLELLSAMAIAENVVRLGFDQPVYISRLLDEADASVPAHYTFVPDIGTVGWDGQAPRRVDAVSADLARGPDGLVIGSGKLVDVVLDRPMTPYPAKYLAVVDHLLSADLVSSLDHAVLEFDAIYKTLQAPTLEVAIPVKDIANPQDKSALLDPVPDPNDPLNLGTFVVDDTGDVGFDEGITSLKKRILRRLVTRPSAFAHLPGYGIGIPLQGKRLAQPAVIAKLTADAEAQIALEPEVAKVRVRALQDVQNPNLVRFSILVRTRTGGAQRLDVPFVTT